MYSIVSKDVYFKLSINLGSVGSTQSMKFSFIYTELNPDKFIAQLKPYGLSCVDRIF